MQAIKDNRVYTITEADIESFRKEGYDIYENGKVIAYGQGKTVPYEKYAQLVDDYEKLMEENAELTSKLKKLEKKAKEEK